jgi:phosphoenolpyruvate carboxylase
MNDGCASAGLVAGRDRTPWHPARGAASLLGVPATPRSRPGPNAAVRAEPHGIGTAGARDPLAREVKLLGALLGQVIAEQAGEDLLRLVERVRRLTIELRRTGRSVHRRELLHLLEHADDVQLEALIRAFSLYFHLTNIAEEKHRVRRLRQRARAATRSGLEGSAAAAILRLRREASAEEERALLEELSVGLVLTAHPTEARRRTLLVALRRCFRLLDRLDDPRLTPAEDADTRRRLREEIALLWHTSALRQERPTPLDEVRTLLVFFDESLFVVTPRLYRALDAALDTNGRRAGRNGPANGPARDSGRTGTRLPRVGAFLRWGSWVGSDRDGHPHVTAGTTREAASIGADHVLRGYEAVSTRLMYTIAAIVPDERLDERLASRLARDRDELDEAYETLEARFPAEPFRRRFGSIAERVRRTRHRLVDGEEAPGGYARPEELLTELTEIADALVADGLARVAYGEVQDLRWQVETFGFHALSLEVRQHSEVHAATLDVLGEGSGTDSRVVAPDVTAGEVLATFRAIADIQAAFGPDACRRYVISFTHRAQDVLDVLRLAEHGGLDAGAIDVVPLFESADALETADAILDDLLADPGYRSHLQARGDQQEVMLGYSDSTKESGALAAAWLLHRAQAQLAAAAERHGIRLTLFHGRGGAIGRGGGPMNRAILAGAPHSLRGHLKLTEQGEVVADRYANPAIALRHLEQLVNAVLIASSSSHEEAARLASERGAAILDELAATSRRAYRELVWEDPAFEAYFRAATPIEELSGLAIGSRPAARGGGAGSLASLRAIPWVFSWSQSRANLPAWYGIGSAVEAYEREHGEEGARALRDLYHASPFLAGVIDVVEMALAKADMPVAMRYASLARRPHARRIWRSIRGEYRRTVAAVARLTGRARLLDAAPTLQRAIVLRNPYVDSLSEIQVLLLGRLRELDPDDPERERLRRLVQLTVSGVAAGLQNTG